MEKRMELGNQQERREADLHWLGGLFDGEGCISILRRGDNLGGLFNVQCRIVQASQSATDEIGRILKANDVAFFVYSIAPRGLSKRTTLQTIVSGFKRSKRFIEVLMPYIRLKKDDAHIALAFIESRLERKAAPYNETEIELYLKLRDLHGYKLRESSETIRRTLMGRYSPNSDRKTESEAEMTSPA